MVRIFPYRAIQFMAFDKYKKILSKQLGVSGHIHRPVVGAMAGERRSVVERASFMAGRENPENTNGGLYNAEKILPYS